jgi:alpha-mannosidase
VKSIHLICNAHLDPVWLWEWEEGAAEAVSTFRAAADLCEEFDSFIFNHNEALLYKWVEEYEPELFRRIQKLVRKGRWHIMGGWYVQPDCNMPCGESLIRQILLGRQYFSDKFGVRPATAINFDPFGHTRGLVQILKKSGFDSYICCRPGRSACPLPAEILYWEGYDGSRILLARADSYNSPLGEARVKLERFLKTNADDSCTLLLWGVGNHGGGPSRKDIRDLNSVVGKTTDIQIAHSTPEAFFREISSSGQPLAVHRGGLNPFAVGCYTSQVRIKQKHRALENELYAAEKMASAAWSTGSVKYPAVELRDAACDLAFSEFHDILPGSSIQRVEEHSLRIMDRALENLSRIRTRAFFALAQGQSRARKGQIPILVYNPHAFPVTGIVECEFQLEDQNWDNTFTQVSVFAGNRQLPSQVEKELSNVPLDWRKRIAFRAELAPGRMNRFDCRLERLRSRPKQRLSAGKGRILFATDDLKVEINKRTGLMDNYVAAGRKIAGRGACRPLVIRDSADPWGMEVSSFKEVIGTMRLLSAEKSAEFAGIEERTLAPVRIIEDGPVRTVVEALFGYGDSFMCMHYKLPKQGTEIELEIRVFWNEKDRMLKLAIPTPDKQSKCYGQTAFGREELPDSGVEAVAQKWTAVVSSDKGTALTCINEGSHGLSFQHGELRLSLLRSAGYSVHPIRDRVPVPQDRFSPRMEQGERSFRFWLNGGQRHKRMKAVEREALAKNEKPMALSFFPSGKGAKGKPFVVLDDAVILVSAMKKAEGGNSLIIRLFEPTGRKRTTTVALPFANTKRRLSFKSFEIKTLKINLKTRSWTEVNLIEERLR